MPIEREGSFYPIFPVLDGKPLNLQWGEIRSNTSETKAIVRNSIQELESGVDSLNALRSHLGQEYGDLDFRNKWSIYYNPVSQEYTIRKNTGTVDTPVWEEVVQVRFNDGQFQVVSTGGIYSAAGFYGPGLTSIQEVAESGSAANVSVSNPTKIFFNADSGLQVTEIASGANKGQPEITAESLFGTAQSFEKTGAEWAVQHNYGLKPVLVQVMDSDDRVIIPDKADLSDLNIAYFYFNEVITGTAMIASGGVGAASLVPRDPFYLVVRTDTQSAADNLFSPNADLSFDSNFFYVQVDLDTDTGGAHKQAFVSLTLDAWPNISTGPNDTVQVDKAAVDALTVLDGDSKNITPDFALSNTYFVALEKNTTINNPTNLPGAGLAATVQIVTEQPPRGFYSITWDDQYMFPLEQLGDRGGPNPTQAEECIDVFTFVSIPNLRQGEKLLGVSAHNFY